MNLDRSASDGVFRFERFYGDATGLFNTPFAVLIVFSSPVFWSTGRALSSRSVIHPSSRRF